MPRRCGAASPWKPDASALRGSLRKSSCPDRYRAPAVQARICAWSISAVRRVAFGYAAPRLPHQAGGGPWQHRHTFDYSRLHLQPKSAFSPFSSFRRAGLEGRLRVESVGRPRDSRGRRPNRRSRLRGGEFGYEAVAPAVLGVKERLRGGRELRLAVILHDARDGVKFSVADPELDPRLLLDVAHPIGSRARQQGGSARHAQ